VAAITRARMQSEKGHGAKSRLRGAWEEERQTKGIPTPMSRWGPEYHTGETTTTGARRKTIASRNIGESRRESRSEKELATAREYRQRKILVGVRSLKIQKGNGRRETA